MVARVWRGQQEGDHISSREISKLWGRGVQHSGCSRHCSVVYLKAAKRVNPKSSHHEEKTVFFFFVRI